MLGEPAASFPCLLALFSPFPFSFSQFFISAFLSGPPEPQDQRICRVNLLVVGDFWKENTYLGLVFQSQVTGVS